MWLAAQLGNDESQRLRQLFMPALILNCLVENFSLTAGCEGCEKKKNRFNGFL